MVPWKGANEWKRFIPLAILFSYGWMAEGTVYTAGSCPSARGDRKRRGGGGREGGREGGRVGGREGGRDGGSERGKDGRRERDSTWMTHGMSPRGACRVMKPMLPTPSKGQPF